MPRAMTFAPVAGSSWATAKTSPDTVRNSGHLAARNQCGLAPGGFQVRHGAHPVPAGCGSSIWSSTLVYCGFKYGGHPGPSLIHPLRAQTAAAATYSKLGARCFIRHAVDVSGA